MLHFLFIGFFVDLFCFTLFNASYSELLLALIIHRRNLVLEHRYLLLISFFFLVLQTFILYGSAPFAFLQAMLVLALINIAHPVLVKESLASSLLLLTCILFVKKILLVWLWYGISIPSLFTYGSVGANLIMLCCINGLLGNRST